MADEVADGFVRVRLDLSYDGKDFSGWAKQPSGRRTVQGEIEAALRTVTRSPTNFDLTVAGRTDAGVHARGQVAHVDLPREVWAEHEEKLLRRLAGRLPHDVRVWKAARAPEGFNARFSAIWRRYQYRVTDHPGGVDPLIRSHVLWHDWELDVEKMNTAAALLVGEHDFAAYCKKREGATTIRTLQELWWERGGGRGRHRDRAGRRLLPQHGALAGGRAAVCRGRAPGRGVAGEGAGGAGAGLGGARGEGARAHAGGGGVSGGRAARGAGGGGTERADAAGERGWWWGERGRLLLMRVGGREEPLTVRELVVACPVPLSVGCAKVFSDIHSADVRGLR
ncbi:hypothetical protein GCM10018987_67660 [Streptomyces cremeus]